MSLTKEDIEKIAKLARIELSGDEREKIAGELSAVLDYFKKLQELDTSGVDLNLSESADVSGNRSDESVDSGIQEEILNNAPAMEDRFIKVKSVL